MPATPEEAGTNALASLLALGGSAVGSWCTTPATLTAEVLTVDAVDFVCFDCQHGLVDGSSLVILPPGPAGDALKELVGRAIPEAPATVLRGEGDVLICGEAAGLSVPRMAGALIGQEAGYREIAKQVLTRTDVHWTPLPVG